MTRAFSDPDVVRVEGSTDAEGDIETISTELILADLQTLEKTVPRLEKEVRIKKGDAALLDAAQKAQAVLEAGTTLFQGAAAAGLDLADVASLQLLTAKPFIYVFNTDDAGLADEDLQARLRALVAPAQAIFLDAKFESELVELEPDEAKEMLAESGQAEAGLDQLARVGFDTLGLQTYLTAGPKEARAWTIRKGGRRPRRPGSSTPTSSAASSRRRSSRSRTSSRPGRSPRRVPRARRASRARTTSWPTATWWSSASTSETQVTALGARRIVRRGGRPCVRARTFRACFPAVAARKRARTGQYQLGNDHLPQPGKGRSFATC